MEPKLFTTAGGKDYRTAGTINLDKVKKFLESKGYDILEIDQLWRHVTGKLKKGKGLFFFKMATTLGVAERTKNEFAWNEEFHKHVKNSEQSFTVPRNKEYGFYDDTLFYFISDYFEGDYLATKYPQDKKDLEKWLERIAAAALCIQNLAEMNLPKDEDTKKKLSELGITKAQYMHKNASEWAKSFETDVSDLLKIVRGAEQSIQTATSHGDFIPWHMREIGNARFGLVDGEHAAGLGVKYYDAAYFYHRVYTSLEEPYIAKQFLKTLKTKLDNKEKNLLLEEIRPILALRCIGGFFDAENEGKTDTTLHKKLMSEIITGEI